MDRASRSTSRAFMVRVAAGVIGAAWAAWGTAFIMVLGSNDTMANGLPSVVTGVLLCITIVTIALILVPEIQTNRDELRRLHERLDQIDAKLDRSTSRPNAGGGPNDTTLATIPRFPAAPPLQPIGRVTVVPVAPSTTEQLPTQRPRSNPRPTRRRDPRSGRSDDDRRDPVAALPEPAAFDEVLLTETARAVELGRALEAERHRRGEDGSAAPA